jgi:hypothetical protein
MKADAPRRHAVVVTKDSGKRICFGVYPSLREAQNQADGLRALLPVKVEIVAVREGTVVAGMTMPARAREAQPWPASS